MQVQAALRAITEACRSERGGNLLALGVEASRARATLGEITNAMLKLFNRYVATGQMTSGAYRSAFDVHAQKELQEVTAQVEVSSLLLVSRSSSILFTISTNYIYSLNLI